MSGSRVAGVVGGGTMGVGIAHVLLAAGATVTLAEVDQERAWAARSAVARSLDRAAERDRLAGVPAELLDRLTVVPDIGALPPEADLIVEAVPEDLDLKRRLLGVAARTCPGAVLASNTSSLSISRLAEELPGGRVIGMHFFNPVPARS